MTPHLSLVVCVLDEAEAIGAVLQELDEQLHDIAAEIIVVDDSADEATAAVVRAFVPKSTSVRLLRRSGARGLASAAAEGWMVARGRILGLMDGDGQHDPSVIPRLLEQLERQDADIAVASRYVRDAHTGLRGYRQALSVSGTLLAKSLTGVATSDPLSGFFLFQRAWWEAARSAMNPMGYKVLLDLALSGPRRARVSEVPTSLRTRLGGASKLDFRVLADLAAQLVEKTSHGIIPARFVLFGTVGASGVAVNVGLLTAGVRIGLPYWGAALLAVVLAMTSNFLLNNLLTFRDRRLSGLAMWGGLLSFYAACAGGAVINELVGLALHGAGLAPSVAGLCGAIVAAVWNYAGASALAWGKGATDHGLAGAGGPKLGEPR
jgi:dolichol-phosphate mannosyltransferase